MNSEEPKKVGKAKTSVSGENASTIHGEMMLPWEARKGFLWGLPATVLLFCFKPWHAYKISRFDKYANSVFVAIFFGLLTPFFWKVYVWTTPEAPAFLLKILVEFFGDDRFNFWFNHWLYWSLICGLFVLAFADILGWICYLVLIKIFKLKTKLSHVASIFCMCTCVWPLLTIPLFGMSWIGICVLIYPVIGVWKRCGTSLLVAVLTLLSTFGILLIWFMFFRATAIWLGPYSSKGNSIFALTCFWLSVNFFIKKYLLDRGVLKNES